MKFLAVFLYMLLAFCAGAAFAGPNPGAVVGGVQDERIADVEAVQAAIKAAPNAEERSQIVAAFQQRESRRAAEAGAASLQAELARQAGRREAPASPAK